MSSQDHLYQELILDHFKNPRKQAEVNEDELLVEEYNPSCGDIIRLAFDRDHDVLTNVHYEAKGCAISVASSSIMASLLDGQSADAARSLVEAVLAAFADTGGGGDDLEQQELAALLTVKNFPMRLKCATLPWVAMKKVL